MTNNLHRSYKIAGIGEVLWDLLPDGKKLGGAPANFCYHSRMLGNNASIISAVGKDDLGKEIIQQLDQKSVLHFLNILDLPTGTVSVTMTNSLPSYEIHQNVAWDNINLEDKALNWLADADAFCFGSLAQRSETSSNAIQNALVALPNSTLKVFDINLRQQYYSAEIIHHSLQKANVVKLNEEEIETISMLFSLKGSQMEQCLWLIKEYKLQLLALTLGSNGSWLITPTTQSYLPVPKVKVVDTVGAGDSFTAVLVDGLLRQKAIKTIHTEATEYAAKVCLYKGAMPSF